MSNNCWLDDQAVFSFSASAGVAEKATCAKRVVEVNAGSGGARVRPSRGGTRRPGLQSR
jgi:hypothetical protein